MKFITTGLLFILIGFVDNGSRANYRLTLQDNSNILDSLRSRCFSGDIKACDSLATLIKKECDEIKNEDYLAKSNCAQKLICWGNIAISLRHLNETKLLYGKESNSYQESLIRFQQILKSSDSCRFTIIPRTF